MVIQCMVASTKGVEADYLLNAYIKNGTYKNTPTIIGNLADRIRTAGFALDEKLAFLDEISASVEESDIALHQILRWTEFRVKESALKSCDALDYISVDAASLDHLRAIPYLRIAGHEKEIARLLGDLYRVHGNADFSLVSALIEYRSGWLIENIGMFDREGQAHLTQLAFLDLLARIPPSEEVLALQDRCVSIQVQSFEQAGINQRDAILRYLMRAGYLEQAQRLCTLAPLPDTVLSRLNLEGYRYFARNDYRSARDCFSEVVHEDPSDAFAGTGLRFALPRIGYPMDEILRVRDQTGYGTKGAGRPGARMEDGAPGPDLTISLLMTGKYVEGHYTKRYADQWLLLKQHYGPKFLNYEPLPEGKDSHLFVIGDDGVGDEIRAAQFYHQLQEDFRKVSVSCDPRLLNIFSTSFPRINFIPVARHRQGLHKPRDISGERLAGFNQKISDFLTESCRPILETADVITMGQGLLLNHFLEILRKPASGPYLECTAEPRLQPIGKLRVGLLWRSHFDNSWRRFMYLRLEDFSPILSMEGIEFWSIQHSISVQEREFCREHGVRLIEDIDLFNDFDGLAEYLKSMDLLVGISSLPIELGAALGVPIWMLGFSPENYFLRTAGGVDEHDRYTMNSTVIKPSSVDFCESRSDCCSKIFAEVARRLQHLSSSCAERGK